MTTLGVLALLLFAQVPQGRVCMQMDGKQWCTEWTALEAAKRQCEAFTFQTGMLPDARLEVRSQENPNLPAYRPPGKRCE